MQIPDNVIAAAKQSQSQSGLWASLTLAQWAVESGWGQHCPGNNPFGITFSSSSPASQLLWTHECVANKDVPAWQRSHPELRVSSTTGDKSWIEIQRKFAAYPTLEDAFEDHARLLTQGKPYAEAWAAHSHDANPFQFISEIAPIYASDPNYATTLLNVIAKNELTQYDVT